MPTLKGANLREANLQGADLSAADLREADLRGADLTRADLRMDSVWGYTRLRGANLDGVNVCDAVMDEGLKVELNCR